MKTKKLYFMESHLDFMESHLAGRQYHEADEAWDKLKIGTLLRLERDLDNHFDPHAVAVMLDVRTEEPGNPETPMVETFHLGYLPARENKEIALLLEMGWDNVFECRISKIDPGAHYENQIRLKICIKRNEER
ncbi:MAG: HIRAN domain-containing protein [Kiritimatiellia bacterium]